MVVIWNRSQPLIRIVLTQALHTAPKKTAVTWRKTQLCDSFLSSGVGILRQKRYAYHASLRFRTIKVF